MSSIPQQIMIKPNLAVPIPKPGADAFQSFLEFFENRSFRRLIAILGIGSAAAVAFTVYHRNLRRYKELPLITIHAEEESKKPEEEEVKVEEKKVILYQVPRGFFTPAVAPFALKLETFLRVAKIPYEIHLSTSNNEVETPWIKFGDEEIKDNHDCISFLCDKFNINLSQSAASSRKTASLLVNTTLDSRLYWAIALWRWVFDEGKSLKDIQPLAPSGEAVLQNVREAVMRAAHYQGIGRIPKEKVLEGVVEDLHALASALGKHKFFLGDSPGEIDCNAFAILAQMVWNMPGSPFEKSIKKHSSLMDFVIRMREIYWPDWNNLIQQPQDSKISSEINLIEPFLSKSKTSFKTTSKSSKISVEQKPEADSAPGTSTIPPQKGKEEVPNNSTTTNAEEMSEAVSSKSFAQLHEDEPAPTVKSVLPSSSTSAPAGSKSLPSALANPQSKSGSGTKSSGTRSPTLSQAQQPPVSNPPSPQSGNQPIYVQKSQSRQQPAPVQVQRQQPQQEMQRPQPKVENLVSIRDIGRENNYKSNNQATAQLTESHVRQIQNYQKQVIVNSVQQENLQQNLRNGINAVNMHLGIGPNNFPVQQQQFIANIQPQQVRQQQDIRNPYNNYAQNVPQLQSQMVNSMPVQPQLVNVGRPMEQPQQYYANNNPEAAHLESLKRATDVFMKQPNNHMAYANNNTRIQDQHFLQATGAFQPTYSPPQNGQGYNMNIRPGTATQNPHHNDSRIYGGYWQ